MFLHDVNVVACVCKTAEHDIGRQMLASGRAPVPADMQIAAGKILVDSWILTRGSAA